MKIGVDGSCWSNQRGYGRYTRELLRALATLDQRDEYRVFLSAATAGESDELPASPRWRRVAVETRLAPTLAASASGHRSLRDMWAMGTAVRRHGRDLDLFFFPSVYTFFPLRSRPKVVVTIHDTIAERFPRLTFPSWRNRLFWRLKVRWAIRQSDVVATVSEAARQDIVREFGLPERAVKVIPDAVSARFHVVGDRARARQALARLGLDDDRRIILYVGGISPHKNLATLVDAYASLAREAIAADVRLVLAGDFQKDVFLSGYSALRQKITDLGLSDRVVFTGYVTDSDLLHLYNAAECLVLPSFMEGFGLPALEAMACGTPVVASRVGALSEVVGEGGLFFDPQSPDELRDRLRELLTDERLREEVGRRALCRAGAFTWDRSARAALATFEELVDTP